MAALTRQLCALTCHCRHCRSPHAPGTVPGTSDQPSQAATSVAVMTHFSEQTLTNGSSPQAHLKQFLYRLRSSTSGSTRPSGRARRPLPARSSWRSLVRRVKLVGSCSSPAQAHSKCLPWHVCKECVRLMRQCSQCKTCFTDSSHGQLCMVTLCIVHATR